MESQEAFKPEKVAVVDNKDGLFYIRFYTKLQSFNIKNRNGRVYEGGPMMESLNAPHIQELIAKKSWMGEAGHPDTDDNMRRILTIDPTKISHKITSIDATINGVWGWIETLPTRLGTDMSRLVLQGMEAAFSLRALAPLVKDADGSSRVKSRSHIVCYDWVILPSHPDAYQDVSKPIERVTKNIEGIGNSVTESVCTPITESALMDYIAESSVNVKSVMEGYGLDLINASVTKDLKRVLLKEGSHTFSINLEDAISHNVGQYLRKM